MCWNKDQACRSSMTVSHQLTTKPIPPAQTPRGGAPFGHQEKAPASSQSRCTSNVGELPTHKHSRLSARGLGTLHSVLPASRLLAPEQNRRRACNDDGRTRHAQQILLRQPAEIPSHWPIHFWFKPIQMASERPISPRDLQMLVRFLKINR